MNRILGGGLAFGLAAIGSVALAVPSGADEHIPGGLQIEGALSADLVAPGDTITASSVDPCGMGADTLLWAVVDEVEPLLTGEMPLGEDGEWELDFAAPDEVGEYAFMAVCESDYDAVDDVVALDLVGDDLKDSDEGEHRFEYYDLPFAVAEETTTTTVPIDTTAPPAVAVVGEPDFTG